MSCKIVTVGDSGVGKTTLLLALLRAMDPDHARLIDSEPASTIGLDIMEVHGGKLSLWDTAGQERFAPFTKTYVRDANIVLCVCSAVDMHSVDKLRTLWIPNVCGSAASALRILVCTKADQSSQVGFDTPEIRAARALAQQMRMPFALASGLGESKIGIEELSNAIGSAVVHREEETHIRLLDGSSSRGRRRGRSSPSCSYC